MSPETLRNWVRRDEVERGRDPGVAPPGSPQTYGAPRLHAELRLGNGLRVGKKRVARPMREPEIQGVSRRPRPVRTTTPDKRAAPALDLAQRDFTATKPDQTWVADITYVPTYEGWLLLAG